MSANVWNAKQQVYEGSVTSMAVPSPTLLFRLDFSLIEPHDVLDNGKAEPGAAHFAAAAFVDAVKALEDAVGRFRRDPHASVGYRQCYAANQLLHGDGDAPAFPVIFYCIVEQIENKLRHAVGVRVHKTVVTRDCDGHIFFRSLNRERLRHPVRDREQTYARPARVLRDGFQLRKLQNIVDEHDHPICFGAD